MRQITETDATQAEAADDTHAAAHTGGTGDGPGRCTSQGAVP